MKAKDLIRLNNEKRERLSKENLEYYNDLLVYTRLSFHKSEQETEEILSELLDHLLEAQAEGKTAQDIFGDDPKKYAESILGELPRMAFKEWGMFAVAGIFYFFAASTIITGLFALFMDGSRTYYAGTVAIKVMLSFPLAMLILYMIMLFLRWFVFSKLNKVAEFLLLWLFGTGSAGLFFVVFFLTPEFGPTVEVPAYAVLATGIVLCVFGRLVQKIGK
ncbi:DUF1129 family protein [Xylanibacillus composti]|uniref:DUF1129 family protein n=1 Tax=Xylanibacillus composti TaxID=1572762 RepID=A0A8J4H539_9BACL|nr:DUF1129 family protein [Xylanibacillus composti]MDT9724851.1 DUF1129 family protein [Xylanibacillus composti]GIQ69054.1 hypothetical protein XYCOK13_18780 [Xylanibacillus composti]